MTIALLFCIALASANADKPDVHDVETWSSAMKRLQVGTHVEEIEKSFPGVFFSDSEPLDASESRLSARGVLKNFPLPEFQAMALLVIEDYRIVELSTIYAGPPKQMTTQRSAIANALIQTYGEEYTLYETVQKQPLITAPIHGLRWKSTAEVTIATIPPTREGHPEIPLTFVIWQYVPSRETQSILLEDREVSKERVQEILAELDIPESATAPATPCPRE